MKTETVKDNVISIALISLRAIQKSAPENGEDVAFAIATQALKDIDTWWQKDKE